MGRKKVKSLLPVMYFHTCFMEMSVTVGEYKLLVFLSIGQICNLQHFDILTRESIGNPKILTIWETNGKNRKFQL